MRWVEINGSPNVEKHGNTQYTRTCCWTELKPLASPPPWLLSMPLPGLVKPCWLLLPWNPGDPTPCHAHTKHATPNDTQKGAHTPECKF